MTKIDDIFGENDEKVCGDAAGGLSFIIATPARTSTTTPSSPTSLPTSAHWCHTALTC